MEILLYVTAAFCIAAALVLLVAVILRMVYKRSVRATIAEWYLSVKSHLFTPDKAKAELEKLKREGEKPYTLPKGARITCDIEEHNSCGLQVFAFNPSGGGAKIIYFYGGGYVHRPLKYHINFLNKLSERCDCRIIMPIYPGAPVHTFDFCYKKMEGFCLSEMEKEDVIFMGDSSGGGLALGLTLRLKEEGKPLPSRLILFAPWVDLTMTNERIPEFEKTDPRNSRWLASLWAGAWSDGHDLKDYRLSPIYGRLNGLPPVVQYVGTRDLLYPDCELLHNKLKASGVRSSFVTGRGLNHVYPIYPIPEARAALDSVAMIIGTKEQVKEQALTKAHVE